MKKWTFLLLIGAICFFATAAEAAVGSDATSTSGRGEGDAVSRGMMYLEYETLVLAPLSNPRDASVQNWRELYLTRVKQYGDFLKKYPASPLEAEAKLRIAELYKDVEKAEVYSFRLELARCFEQYSDKNGGTLEKRKACQERFDAATVRWRDPVYMKKAADLLIELVRDYGHTRRYALVITDFNDARTPKHFEWVEEEIGAQALYYLSWGAEPVNKKKILLRIQSEYKAGERLQGLITEDLEKVKDIKIK